MATLSFPYNPTNIISPDLADDNKFKQWIEFTKQSFIQSGWSEVTDAGYIQPWINPMAFSTTSNVNTGVNTGGTNASSMSQYPNLAMDNSTTTFWESNGQPVLGAANYALGYDAGIGNTINPVYYNLWIQGAAAATDPVSWVVEYSDALDTNYDWAGSTWTPIQSVVNCTSGTANCSVTNVSLTPGGTGWIVNTTAAVTTTTNGVGAVLQPVIVSGAITSILIANPGIAYQAGDTITFTVASAGSGATATVGTVNAAGQILTVTIGGGGSAYVANPVVTASGGTGTSTYAVFTNAAIGVSGAIQQVIPCVGSTGYTSGTAPTIGTITQTTGGSTPTSAPACTAHITASTGALSRFDIPTLNWASVTSPAGPAHRAFRIRILSNVSSITSVNIYEWDLYNYAATFLNNAPTRLSPTSAQTSFQAAWKLFKMTDTIQTASGSSGCAVYCKVAFGSGSTWNYPSIWVTLGPGTDGAGNVVGPQTTPVMQLAGASGSPTVAPFWSNGNTNWAHITAFKGTSAEICLHIERNQTSAGADDPTAGASAFGATSAVADSLVEPQYGAAPSMETKWGAILGQNAGSTLGAVTQIAPVLGRNFGWTYPLRHMWVCETASGLPDGTVTTITDSYANSVSAFVDAKMCTSVAQGLTSGRVLVKNTQ